MGADAQSIPRRHVVLVHRTAPGSCVAIHTHTHRHSHICRLRRVMVAAVAIVGHRESLSSYQEPDHGVYVCMYVCMCV